MENYLAELVKNRQILLKSLMDTSWTFSGKQKQVDEINKQLEKIDAMIELAFDKPRKNTP